MTTAVEQQLEIRLAAPCDAPDLACMYTALAEWRLEKYGMNHWPIPFPESKVEQLIEESDTYLAHVGKILVGAVSLEYTGNNIWQNQPEPAVYVRRLCARVHGYNIGSQLLELADVAAFERQVSYVRLDCDADNSKLREHYESLGFISAGVRRARPAYTAARYERFVL